MKQSGEIHVFRDLCVVEAHGDVPRVKRGPVTVVPYFLEHGILLVHDRSCAGGDKYGLQVVELADGKLKDGGIRQGFIITRVNRTPIRSEDDLKRVLSISSGGVLIEGVYPNGTVGYYAIGVD